MLANSLWTSYPSMVGKEPQDQGGPSDPGRDDRRRLLEMFPCSFATTSRFLKPHAGNPSRGLPASEWMVALRFIDLAKPEIARSDQGGASASCTASGTALAGGASSQDSGPGEVATRVGRTVFTV